MITIASAHSLADISVLPWWAQLCIGLGLVFLAMVFGWLADRADSCLPVVAAGLLGFAGIAVTCNALFGG